jgi:chromosome segregation ATPase
MEMEQSGSVVIRSLKAEIASLKEMISQITTENANLVDALNREIATLRSESPVPKEEQLMQEIAELKKQQAESMSRKLTEPQSEISTLRLEIAELKNSLAQRSAENTRLTLDNIELHHQIRAMNEELSQSKSVFEQGASNLIRRQIQIYKTVRRHLRDLDASVGGLANSVGVVEGDRNRYRSLLEQNEKTVEYLSRSLAVVADLPQIRPPTPRELLESPEKVIKLVNSAESNSRREKTELQRSLAETTQSLSVLVDIVHRPPVSRPVAAVLTNLGAVMMEVNAQLNEEHEQTMKLLNGDRTDSDA